MCDLSELRNGSGCPSDRRHSGTVIESIGSYHVDGHVDRKTPARLNYGRKTKLAARDRRSLRKPVSKRRKTTELRVTAEQNKYLKNSLSILTLW